MGDVKLLAMIGAFLGWKLVLLTLVLASFSGSLIGVALIASKRGDMKYALPFGTFLAIGAVVSAAWAVPSWTGTSASISDAARLVSRIRSSSPNSRAGHPAWLRCSSLTYAQ